MQWRVPRHTTTPHSRTIRQVCIVPAHAHASAAVAQPRRHRSEGPWAYVASSLTKTCSASSGSCLSIAATSTIYTSAFVRSTCLYVCARGCCSCGPRVARRTDYQRLSMRRCESHRGSRGTAPSDGANRHTAKPRRPADCGDMVRYRRLYRRKRWPRPRFSDAPRIRPGMSANLSCGNRRVGWVFGCFGVLSEGDCRCGRACCSFRRAVGVVVLFAA